MSISKQMKSMLDEKLMHINYSISPKVNCEILKLKFNAMSKTSTSQIVLDFQKKSLDKCRSDKRTINYKLILDEVSKIEKIANKLDIKLKRDVNKAKNLEKELNANLKNIKDNLIIIEEEIIGLKLNKMKIGG